MDAVCDHKLLVILRILIAGSGHCPIGGAPVVTVVTAVAVVTVPIDVSVPAIVVPFNEVWTLRPEVIG